MSYEISPYRFEPDAETEASLVSGFDGIERVIADPLRFKLKLGIGEDAFAALKLKRTLQEVWDAGGMAATAAGVMASKTVAATLFASTAKGGLLALIGLGTAAATPVGWIVAAAVVSGSAYYGVTRLFGRFQGSKVDVIPRFINTPLDLLGASLFDLMGALAVRLAHIDGDFDETERAAIVGIFVEDWGYDRSYVDQALTVLAAGRQQQGVKEIAQALAEFQVANPDCNPAAMRAEMITLLRRIAEADGTVDEREDLAIEAVEARRRRRCRCATRGGRWGVGRGRRGMGRGGRRGGCGPGERATPGRPEGGDLWVLSVWPACRRGFGPSPSQKCTSGMSWCWRSWSWRWRAVRCEGRFPTFPPLSANYPKGAHLLAADFSLSCARGRTIVQRDGIDHVRAPLRWAGSKRKSLPHLVSRLPKSFTTYVEPFAGSACLVFAAIGEPVVLGDLNPDLISFYSDLKDDAEALFDKYISIPRTPEKYYEIRTSYNEKSRGLIRSSQFLYLNRLCFNGIYRVNKSGKFNVPWGGDSVGRALTLLDLQKAAARLENATLVCDDFETVVRNHLVPGAFVFLDPPYATSDSRVFREYHENSFASADWDRLVGVLKAINAAGAYFMMSYADTSGAAALLSDWHVQSLEVTRNVGGFRATRRKHSEIFVTNYGY